MRPKLASAILALFSTLTLVALRHHGYWGLFQPLLTSWGGLQVLLDLAISLSMVMGWIWGDARRRGVNPYPWVVGALLTGSLAPLLYFTLRRDSSSQA